METLQIEGLNLRIKGSDGSGSLSLDGALDTHAYVEALGVMNSNLAHSNLTVSGLQPNEVDRKRIERAIQNRKRYLYVTPKVHAIADGYVIRSANCSRNVDSEGGDIDVAKLEFKDQLRCWWLYHKDHEIGYWIMHGEYGSLTQILSLLNEDPDRRFWQ